MSWSWSGKRREALPDTRLARPEGLIWTDPEWHRLWLSLRARPWMTLVVVPGGRGISGEVMLGTAVTLSRTGAAHLRTPIHVADATSITLSRLGAWRQELEQCKQTDAPVIIALAQIIDNPAALAIAQQAEAALLCVQRGETLLADIESTTADVGVSRFLGAVMFGNGARA